MRFKGESPLVLLTKLRVGSACSPVSVVQDLVAFLWRADSSLAASLSFAAMRLLGLPVFCRHAIAWMSTA